MSQESNVYHLDSNLSLKVMLFKDVNNIEEIKKNVLSGTWNCAVIKPSLILDIFQVVVAANRAVVSAKSNSMVTKTISAEILYNLSLSKNISWSLTKFGIEKENNILVCFFIDEYDDTEDIINQIDGVQCSIRDLHKFTNLNDIKTVYKINSLQGDVDLLDIIVTRMVTKQFVSF